MALSKPKVLLQTLPLLTFLMLLLANQVHSDTYFTFDSFKEKPSDLIYQGDTHVSSDSTLLFIRSDDSGIPQPYSFGRVLYYPLVDFWKPSQQLTFETTIKFKITPVAGRVPADGITFFIAPVDTTIPSNPVGGGFGVFGSSGTGSSIFAVEFDIFSNVEFNDPSYSHIGIDINSVDSVNTTRFENALDKVVTARINYVSNTRTITVTATYGSETAELSYVFNLKTILPQQVRVGISGATGGQVATHELLAWYFSGPLVWDQELKTEEKKTYIHPYV